MIQLTKLRDRIMEFVGRYEIYVMAGIRFVIGYAAFRLIISNLGYSEVLGEYPVAILLALLCCFLPAGVMLFCAAVLILLELYALSAPICLVMALIFLIMFCAYTRFTSRKGLYAVLTPIMSLLGIPYTLPVVTGLRGEPYAVISVICGEMTYFMLEHINFNATLYVVTDDNSFVNVITMAVNELLFDREMYLYLIGFAAAAIVTYCLSRLKFNLSHLVAAAAGIVTQLIIIYVGETNLMNSSAHMRILLGSLVSFLILLIVSFFTHSLNYRRVENVQFEDDDYYYYVRAIPKSFLPPKDWNPTTQTRRTPEVPPETAAMDEVRAEQRRRRPPSDATYAVDRARTTQSRKKSSSGTASPDRARTTQSKKKPSSGTGAAPDRARTTQSRKKPSSGTGAAPDRAKTSQSRNRSSGRPASAADGARTARRAESPAVPVEEEVTAPLVSPIEAYALEESLTSEIPVAESLTAESPATERPTAKRPTTKRPTTKMPTTEMPTTEMPTMKNPTAEMPVTEIPAAESPAAEDPAAESPAAKKTTAKKTTAKKTTTTKKPAAETPAAESPTAESPAAESLTAEIPAAESLTAESPAAEKPAAKKTTTKKTTTKKTTTKKTTAKSPTAEDPAAENPITDSPGKDGET